MLGCMTELGLFFKYSPKRTMLLESIIEEENIRETRRIKYLFRKLRSFVRQDGLRDMWY